MTQRVSYLDQACRDTGAGRDDGLETAVVHHEVTYYNREENELMKRRGTHMRLIVPYRITLPTKQCDALQHKSISSTRVIIYNKIWPFRDVKQKRRESYVV